MQCFLWRHLWYKSKSKVQLIEPVTAVVFGYFKVDKRNNIIDAVDVDNPPIIMNTRGMWIDVPLGALEILANKGYNIAASIHAAEHAILSLLPNFVISSPGDVRTECKAPQKEYAKAKLPISEPILMVDGNSKTTAREVTRDFRAESDVLD